MKNLKITKLLKLVPVIAIILAALFCLSACGGGESAPKADDAKGTIANTNISWSFISKDKTLEISGTGDIPNYTSLGAREWDSIAGNVEKVKLSDGINQIGDLAFAYFSYLTEIDVPNSVTVIGNSAFEGCSKLKSVSIGTGLTSLGERAFAFCGELKSVRILSPVEIKSKTFYNSLYKRNEKDPEPSVVFDARITESMVAADAFEISTANLSAEKETETKGKQFTFAKVTPYSETLVKITVKYQYEDGSEAASTLEKEYNIGSSYKLPSPTIEGFVADKLSADGTAKDDTDNADANVIVITYKEKVEETTAPVEAETNAVAADDKKTSPIFFVIMIVVIVGVAVGAFLLMKSNKKNEEKAKNQNKAKNRKQK